MDELMKKTWFYVAVVRKEKHEVLRIRAFDWRDVKTFVQKKYSDIEDMLIVQKEEMTEIDLTR